MTGRFISLEGSEGCGKSTQAQLLCRRLEAAGLEVLTTREPGGTPTGEMIRNILQHHASGEAIAPEAEVLLFAASRAQLLAHVIRPALARGAWVICDRFVDSSLAYQGVARGLGVDRVLAANEVALAGLWPDLTLWFDLPAAAARQRVDDRGQTPDRFESEHQDFHQRVAEAYAQLAKRFPERITAIPADAPPETVSEHVWSVVRPLLQVAAS